MTLTSRPRASARTPSAAPARASPPHHDQPQRLRRRHLDAARRRRRGRRRQGHDQPRDRGRPPRFLTPHIGATAPGTAGGCSVSGAVPQTARMQLIGRDAPLEVLRAALDRGDGAVLVRGEPGIGKTWLVDALAREAAARGHPVLTGRTDPDDGAPPLWPWLQALSGRPERGRAGGARRTAPGRRPTPPRRHRSAGPRACWPSRRCSTGWPTRPRPSSCWRTCTGRTSRACGCSTLAADRAGVLVVATYRDTEAEPGAAHGGRGPAPPRLAPRCITLRPWDDADVAALLPPRRPPVLGAGAAPHRRRACRCWSPPCCRTCSTPTGRRRSRTRGRRVAARRARPPRRPHRRTAGPAGSGRPAGRRDRGRRGRRLRPGTPRPARRARGGSAAVRRWRRASRPGCWCRSPSVAHGYDLRHALLRDAVYAQVPAVRRVPWHAALADAIEAGELPGEPVTHRLRAAVDPASCAAAVAACRTAAARAEGVLAFDRVVELLDAARRLPGVDRDHPRRPGAGGGGRRVRRRPGGDGGATLPPRWPRRAPPPHQLVRAALTVRGPGRPAQRRRSCCSATPRSPRSPSTTWPGRARVLAQRALAEWESAGWASVDAPSAEALRLAERSGSPAALADALRARQHAVSDVEGVTERLDLAERMITLGAHGRARRRRAVGQAVADRRRAAAGPDRRRRRRARPAGRARRAVGVADRVVAPPPHDRRPAAPGRAVRRRRSGGRPRGRRGPAHRGHHRAGHRRRAARRAPAADRALRRGGRAAAGDPRRRPPAGVADLPRDRGTDLRRGGRDRRGPPDARRAARRCCPASPATAGGSPRSRARACSRPSSRTSRRSRGASTSSPRTAATTSRAGRARCVATGRSAA